MSDGEDESWPGIHLQAHMVSKEDIPRRRKNKYKGPGTGVCLAYVMNNKEPESYETSGERCQEGDICGCL